MNTHTMRVRRTAPDLSLQELRRRTVDGRGIADVRLVQLENGPGRGQRLLVARNAVGIGFEIAVDRGFDISSATWRGINIGWNSANNMPWPANPVDAEGGMGFYRNFDGFIVTCGLDHVGAAQIASAERYIHKHRNHVFNPLHGRVSSQHAELLGYGIDWSAASPVIWAEGLVRQSAMFAENLFMQRRVTVDVFGQAIQIHDVIENRGYRPTPHAILYHVNFGHPFFDETAQISGDLCCDKVAAFNGEDKRPRDDFVDYYEEMPVVSALADASIALRNSNLLGGTFARLAFPREAFSNFGIWRAFQSGVYALALEPSRRHSASNESQPIVLQQGEAANYQISITLGSI